MLVIRHWEVYMRNCSSALVLALFIMPAVGAEPPHQEKTAAGAPPCAYGFETPADPSDSAPLAAPAAAPAPDDGSLRHLPGSTLSFTVTQIRDAYGPADWYPSDHPQMPDVVAHGRQADVRSCSLCHYPNGKGRPENAGVAGLPYTYFLQTMAALKNVATKSAQTMIQNTNLLIWFAKAMSDDEIKAAAQYFSSMKWTPWIKVIETNTVPKTRISCGSVFM